MGLEAYLDKSTKALDSAISKQVPGTILKHCKGVAILSCQEAALIIGGGGGSGVIVKRNDDGSWGPPAAITQTSVNVGANVGIVDKTTLIVPMTDAALKTLTGDNKIHLGAELGLALGKLERRLTIYFCRVAAPRKRATIG